MSVWSDNVHRFASDQVTAARAHSNAGRREAIAHLRATGDAAAAYRTIVNSVERQARILGCGQVTIPTPRAFA